MPTTNEEAAKIVKICQRHNITGRTLFALARDLDDEVGQVSQNDSVKVTMRMLRDAVTGLAVLNPGERRRGPATADSQNVFRPALNNMAACCHAEKTGAVSRLTPFMQLFLFLLVTFHAAVWVGLALSFCVLPFLAPLYVALPCMAFILVQATTSEPCPVTRLENFLREKLGWPIIAEFGPHYFFHWLLGQAHHQ